MAIAAEPDARRDTFYAQVKKQALQPLWFSQNAVAPQDDAVYQVAEGSGYSVLDAKRFDWQVGDTFCVPSWCWQEHAARDREAVLYREQEYADNGGQQPITGRFEPAS